MMRRILMDVAVETESYQALIEQRRAVSGRLDEEPWDADLRDLHDDLDDLVSTARRTMEIAWLEWAFSLTC